MEGNDLQIVPYQRRRFKYREFSCGEPVLDRWLQESAGQNEARNASRTFLLVKKDSRDKNIFGYFTLINCQLVPKDASSVLTRESRYPMPATLIARLAVAENSQGIGLGKALLIEALLHSLKALEFSGSQVVIVDAISESAVRFYEGFGFTRINPSDGRLFMTTRQVQRTFDAAGNRP